MIVMALPGQRVEDLRPDREQDRTHDADEVERKRRLRRDRVLVRREDIETGRFARALVLTGAA